MDKRKLKEIYDSIKKQVEGLGKGEWIDFGAGGLQDSYKQVEVLRSNFTDTCKITIYDPYKKQPARDYITDSIPHITAIVYRTIIDEITEYGTNHNFF